MWLGVKDRAGQVLPSGRSLRWALPGRRPTGCPGGRPRLRTTTTCSAITEGRATGAPRPWPPASTASGPRTSQASPPSARPPEPLRWASGLAAPPGRYPRAPRARWRGRCGAGPAPERGDIPFPAPCPRTDRWRQRSCRRDRDLGPRTTRGPRCRSHGAARRGHGRAGAAVGAPARVRRRPGLSPGGPGHSRPGGRIPRGT